MGLRNGLVVTSNGLTFAASVDEGILRAYDENTRQVLWSVELPALDEQNGRRETNLVA